MYPIGTEGFLVIVVERERAIHPGHGDEICDVCSEGLWSGVEILGGGENRRVQERVVAELYYPRIPSQPFV